MRSRCMLLTAVLSLNGNMADVERGSTELESYETLIIAPTVTLA